MEKSFVQVPEENSTRDLLLFTDGVVPVVNVTILRELTTPESAAAKFEQRKDQVEIGKDFSVYDTGPSTSTYKQERRKSVKRQGSLVKEKSVEEEILGGNFSEAIGQEATTERRKSVKEVEEARKLAKDRRKSLKEQKSIERVNEYLAKHGADSCLDVHSPEVRPERRKSLKETSTRSQVDEKTAPRRESLAVDMGLMMTYSERRKSLTKQDKVEIMLPEMQETAIGIEEMGTGSARRPDELVLLKPEIASPSSPSPRVKPTAEDGECERWIAGRRSSMKTRDTENEETRGLSPGEIARREVTIRENVEEILYENSQEQVTAIPELQLVKAKIISAEEAAAGLAGRASNVKVELNSPPEVLTVIEGSERLTVSKTKIRKAALSAEEQEEGLLNLPGLTKSTSESVLAETEEENTVAVKNFKPDVLLDLSKVPDESESQEKSRDSVAVNSPKEKRQLLIRVGSEGSKKIHESKISPLVSALPKTATVTSSPSKEKSEGIPPKIEDKDFITATKSSEESNTSEKSIGETFLETCETEETSKTPER